MDGIGYIPSPDGPKSYQQLEKIVIQKNQDPPTSRIISLGGYFKINYNQLFNIKEIGKQIIYPLPRNPEYPKGGISIHGDLWGDMEIFTAKFNSINMDNTVGGVISVFNKIK